MAPDDFAVAADAAAAPQALLKDALSEYLPAHLPVPTASETELLDRLDSLTLGADPQFLALSQKEMQLLQILISTSARTTHQKGLLLFK